jgi:hypothetical protein
LAPQLRRLALPIDQQLSRVIASFNCIGDGPDDDPVAENVNGFLRESRYLPGLKHGISSTYLLLDPEKDPVLVGYATLTFDSVRLTNTEKKTMEELMADANVRRIAFYESAGFVRNQAKREAERTDPERSVSMRLDLIDSPRSD